MIRIWSFFTRSSGTTPPLEPEIKGKGGLPFPGEYDRLELLTELEAAPFF